MRVSSGAQHLTTRANSRRAITETPDERDGHGAYAHSELLRMQRRFVERVERAFRNGTETREAAGASYQCEKFSDLPLNRIESPLW
jgi:hypothetical protein